MLRVASLTPAGSTAQVHPRAAISTAVRKDARPISTVAGRTWPRDNLAMGAPLPKVPSRPASIVRKQCLGSSYPQKTFREEPNSCQPSDFFGSASPPWLMMSKNARTAPPSGIRWPECAWSRVARRMLALCQRSPVYIFGGIVGACAHDVRLPRPRCCWLSCRLPSRADYPLGQS